MSKVTKGNLELDSVKRVRNALLDAGVGDTVTTLPETVRSAADAAKALGVEQGAIVKTIVFTVGNRYVFALIAGDHACRDAQLPRAFGLEGAVVRPAADLVRAVTGFSPAGPCGGVSPVGSVSKLAVVIDASLKRFDKLFAAAGHSQCVFETSVEALKTLTGGLMSYAIAEPAAPTDKKA